MHRYDKALQEQWCNATVADAVKMFHRARKHPDNEAESLETIAIRCANTAFQDVAQYAVGDRDALAKRYGQLCYARFRREIQDVITEPEEVEELSH